VFVGSLAVLLGAFFLVRGIVYSRRSHLSGHPLLCRHFHCWQVRATATRRTVVGEYRGFSFASISLRSWLALGYLILSARSWPSPPTTGSSSTTLPRSLPLTPTSNPIVAVLLGWFFAGEAVTLNVLLSTAMVIGAVMLVDRGMARLQRGS